jgi:hypothetical protein
MSQPEILQTLRAECVIPQKRVSEPTKCVATGLVVAGMWVNEVKGFQRLMQMAPNDIGGADRFSFAGLKKKPILPIPREELKKLCDSGMQVNLPRGIRTMGTI